MKNLTFVRCINVGDDPISLTVGEIYEALPMAEIERKDGWLRIVDNEGEPYLHPAHLFEAVDSSTLVTDYSEILTVHVSGLLKLKLRDKAHAKGMSMSALMREIAEERLDLPEIVR